MELLSDRDREVLDFDALEFRHALVRGGEIRRRFGWSEAVFAFRLGQLLATPDGATYATVANRRRRQRRAGSPA